MTTKVDNRTAVIRTVVPALIGVLLARLIAAVPVVAAVLAWVDGVIVETAVVVGAPLVGVTAMWLLNAGLTALVVWAYYRVARALGDRWPSVEKWMLGSEARPHYEARYAATNTSKEPVQVVKLDQIPLHHHPGTPEYHAQFNDGDIPEYKND